jgi:hypothetical protein
MSEIPEDIKNDALSLVQAFYAKFSPEVEKYRHLEIISRPAISEKEFYDRFMNSHEEIRLNSKGKIKYFIQKKANKLHKITDQKLPEHDIIDQMCTTTVDLYWDTLHHMYILLESCMPDVDQIVINTIASEISKYDQKLIDEAQAKVDLIAKKEAQDARRVELLEQKMEKMEMPDMSSLMAGIDDPEMKKMMKKMTKGAGGFDINGAMKAALGENKEVASIVSTLLDNYNSGENKTFDVQNMASVLGSVIPEIDHTCEVNIILVNKIYQDLLYVYEKKDETVPNIDKRIIATANKYMDLVKKGSLKIEELIACLWKVANNEEMQKYVVAMEKEEITAPTIKTLVKKYVPRQMLRQVPVDIDTIIDGICDGNFTDLTSIFDLAKTYMSGQEEEPVTVELTNEQTLELEAYYDKLMSNEGVEQDEKIFSDAPKKSSKKNKKVRK